MEKADQQKLSLREKIAYGMGDLGNGFMFDVGQAYLLHFYTDVLNISAAIGGSVFLVSKFFDAGADTAVGTFVDVRKNIGKRGKLRPFILFGTIPLAIASVLSFLVPDVSMSGKIIYAYITYMLFGLAYSFVNIPYGALAASMTQDPTQRTVLASFRQGASKLGVVITGAAVIPIVMMFSDKAVGYPVAIGAMACCGVLCHLFCYRYTKEYAVSSSGTGQKTTLKQKFGLLLKNGPLAALCFMTLLQISAYTMKVAMSIYYCQYILGDIKLVSAVNAGLTCGLIGVAIMPMVVKKTGKKNAFAFGASIGIAADIINFLLPTNFDTFIVLMYISWFATGFNGLGWAFISDVIDYGEWKSGERTEGIIYSIYSLSRKIAQAVAGFIPGLFLAMAGYVPNAQQSLQSLSSIKGLMFLYPAIVMALAVVCFSYFYKLSDKRHKEIVADIQARNTAEAL